MSGLRTRARRSWRWPLRTGLMVVLSVAGAILPWLVGCGSSAPALPPSASGGQSPAAAGTGGAASTEALAGAGTTGSTQLSPSAGGQGETTPGTASTDATGNCVASSTSEELFADQVYSPVRPPPRILYSWTTPEQIAELRSGGPLFSRSERPDAGRGNALDALARFSTQQSGSIAQLAALLDQQLFAKARYAWTNPWATRMGWPNERYGNQLVRIELAATAWQAEFDGTYLAVRDETGQYVSTEVALENWTRIGSMYFVRQLGAGGPRCTTFGTTGGGEGYREIVLGNLTMVERWSIGSKEISERLNQDLEALAQFQSILTQCPDLPNDPDWNGTVACSWDWNGAASPASYVHSLAIPNDYYQPTANNISRLIETLKTDGFVLDPYVVEVQ